MHEVARNSLCGAPSGAHHQNQYPFFFVISHGPFCSTRKEEFIAKDD
jgi:hypothetical protein